MVGGNILAGADTKTIKTTLKIHEENNQIGRNLKTRNPLGDGKAGQNSRNVQAKNRTKIKNKGIKLHEQKTINPINIYSLKLQSLLNDS